jgi:flagellar hook assembly protein FlgD
LPNSVGKIRWRPQDTGKLLDQIATIRNIQSNTDLTTDLKAVVRESQFASAASTIGQHGQRLDRRL